MAEPKINRKKGARYIRLAKKTTASEAIGEIEKGQDIFILTFGQFSLIDAIAVVLDQTGPADITIATWTAAFYDLSWINSLLESVKIKSFRMIVDGSYLQRMPCEWEHAVSLFGISCLRTIKTHTKFVLIRSDTHNIVIQTSMNLNNNRRLEHIEISEDQKLSDFFQQITDVIFSETKKNSHRQVLPALNSTPDTFQFKKIKAGIIKREDLNEPRTTHVAE